MDTFLGQQDRYFFVKRNKGSSIKDVRKWGEGGSNLFSKVYIGQRGEGVKYWQNSADVLYGWPPRDTVTDLHGDESNDPFLDEEDTLCFLFKTVWIHVKNQTEKIA